MTTRTMADPGSNRLPSDIWAPPVIFVAFVLTGCVFIIVAKEHQLPQSIVTFVPVALMLSYTVLMLFARLLRLRDDQAGDNLYYMGFLFTLTSLGASLYHFNASGDAEYIVKNFGIAIASTIAGIALRVLFNQMRRDPAEVERVARLELADASRRVRAELDQTVLEFNHFRRATLQSMQEGFDAISAHVDEVGKKLLSGLEEVTQKSAAPLEAASKRSGDTIGEVTRTMVAALEDGARKLAGETERLAASASSISETLDGITGKLGSMQSPDEVIRIKLDPTIRGIAGAVDRFSNRLEEHNKGIADAISGLIEAAETANAAAGQGRQASAASEAGMREAADTCLKAVRELSTAITSFGSAAGSQSDRAETILRRTEETLAALKDVASTAADRGAGQVESLARTVTEASERQTGHIESLSKVIPAIEQCANSIQMAVEKITLSASPDPHPPASSPFRWGGLWSTGGRG